MSFHSLLVCKVADETSADSLKGFLLYETLISFKMVSLTLAILITVYLGVGLFGFTLFETLCASWTWMSVSLPRLGKLSAIISLNKVSVPFSFFSFWGSYNKNV